MKAESGQLLKLAADAVGPMPSARGTLHGMPDVYRDRHQEATAAHDAEAQFLALVDLLHSLLEFDEAFLLQRRDPESMVPVVSTLAALYRTVWHPKAAFRRVLAGRMVAVFDVERVPEWARQLGHVRDRVRSVLHIPLQVAANQTILVLTHPQAGHFTLVHIRQAKRCAHLMAQMVLNLDLQKVSAQRDRLLSLSADLMGVVSFSGQLEQVNDAWRTVLGHGVEQKTDIVFLDLIHDDDREACLRELMQLRQRGGQFYREYRFLCNDGAVRWLSCKLAVYPDEEIYYVVAQDVTDRVKHEQRLEHDAQHDSLTGLCNRHAFTLRLQQAIAQARRQQKNRFAVLCLDLDRFKIINNSLSHDAGDELLKEVAHRLLLTVREVDMVARFAGDEFVILLADIEHPQAAARVAERMLSTVSAPIALGGNDITISASVGITLSTAEDQSAEDILRDADNAMHWAKDQGRSTYVVFDPGMHHKALTHLQTENDLRRAIARNELALFYQPILNLETGAIHSFEALLRWRHPTRGLVSPLEFIPIAEETGLIVPIGNWVIEEACRQLKAWQTSYPEHKRLTVNVNISARQFWEKGFLDQVTGIVTSLGLDPETVALEVTESVIVYNADEAVALFHALKGARFQLFIDDFGTGYSSLSYLHQFPFDGIKIDRSFVSRMEADTTSRELVRIILLLAHNLALEVVAEGVETRAECQRLSSMKCGQVQGFLFSRPLPVAEAELLLTKESSISGHID